MGGLPIVVLHSIMLAPVVLGVAVLVALVTRRFSLRQSAATLAGGAVFVALTPYGCGMLHSDPPYTSCSSIAGASWGFWAERGTLWYREPTLTVQAVMLIAATVAALLAVAAVLRIVRRRPRPTAA